MTAPFPWFGGKRRAAPLVWPRFGDVANYVEPFAGSLAIMLARPHAAKTETVNDRDAYLANFWRAVQADPEAVERFTDYPVSEADLHARHVWLLAQTEFRERMLTDPEYFDPKIAGWWVWGISSWIGSGWCDYERTNERTKQQSRQLGRFQNSGASAASEPTDSRTRQSAGRPCRKLPHLTSRQGVCTHARTHARTHRPDDCPSFPVTAKASPSRQGGIFDALAERLRDVRVTCGDWSRVVTPSVTWRHGVTGVLLDPPYSAGEHSIKYGGQGEDVAADVRQWALENGDNPQLRIALCGYDTEHDMPGWSAVAWKAQGGYGSQGKGRGRENAKRETIWFSPHCLRQDESLMGLMEAIA